MIETPWLTDDEALAYLRMTAKHAKKILHRYVRQGKLRAAKRGMVYLHRKEWLDAFVTLHVRRAA